MNACLELAGQYSAAMSAKFPILTGPFLREVLYFTGQLPNGAEFKQYSLKLIAPWVGNFAVILRSGETERAWGLLESLLRITKECNTTPFRPLLENLWALTVKDGSNLEMEAVIDFLSREFFSAELQKSTTENEGTASSNDQVQHKLICKVAINFVSRANRAVTDLLVGKLRNYPAAPTKPEEFIKFFTSKPKTEPTRAQLVAESAAFNSLVDTAFENGLSLVSHLPVLLQNAVVTYGPTRKQKYPECVQMLVNLLWSLGYRHNTEPKLDFADFVEKLEAKRKNVYDEYKPVEFTSEELGKLVDYLGDHRPGLRKNWARLALEWSLQMEDYEDGNAALDSFKLFTVLNQDFTYEMTSRLVLYLFKALVCGEEAKVDACLDFFESAPVEDLNGRENRNLILSLAPLLLETSSTHQFRVCLKLLQTCASEQEVATMWKSGREFARLLFKGFSSSITYEATLAVVTSFAKLNPKDSFIESILIMELLIYAVLALLDEEKAKESVAVLEQIGNDLESFGPIFAAKFSASSSDGGKKIFLVQFFNALSVRFPNQEHFAFSLDACTILLRRGIERWKYPLFKMLGALLNSYTCTIMAEELYHLTELVVYYCNSTNERVATAAEEILPYIVKNLNEPNIPLKLFNFLRKAPPAMYSNKKTESFSR
eukprot:TRINITY_DN8824_c0_g1_i8.p1 TRINITY_DN8824_c0_g1~~TRINITY_DN8824_c0_g1_i8.p1  ORF type:complete len:658 (-),score=203.02 TRINITY_DN8824_c0_g1_i8:501-2474(-)